MLTIGLANNITMQVKRLHEVCKAGLAIMSCSTTQERCGKLKDLLKSRELGGNNFELIYGKNEYYPELKELNAKLRELAIKYDGNDRSSAFGSVALGNFDMVKNDKKVDEIIEEIVHAFASTITKEKFQELTDKSQEKISKLEKTFDKIRELPTERQKTKDIEKADLAMKKANKKLKNKSVAIVGGTALSSGAIAAIAVAFGSSLVLTGLIYAAVIATSSYIAASKYQQEKQENSVETNKGNSSTR